MDLFLQQLANGIALGSVYALIAIGFTLIFGVLRLLNMAHGELYMLGAYMAYLATEVLGLPAWASIPFVIVVVFIIGLLVERTAFKPLRDAPHFIPLVSTIAVSTILLELVRIGFGPYMFGFDSFVSPKSFSVGPVKVSWLQIFMLVLGLATMALVQLFLSRSQWGKAIRAVAQDPKVSGMLGIDVDRVIGLTFAIGSTLGALAGVLIAMYFGAIFPTMGFVALVKAFTAAILGGMGSVPGAVLGGFALGIVESLGSGYLPSGFSDAIPFAVLFLVLLLLPGGLLRSRAATDTHAAHGAAQSGQGLLDRLLGDRGVVLSASGRVEAVAVVGTLVTLCVAPFLTDSVLRILVTILVYATMAFGVNLILGLAGQLSLAHAAFFAIGAYASALLTTQAGFGFWSAMVVGAVFAGGLGAALSMSALRVRGYYLALVTLAFAELVRIVLSYWKGLTGGMMGVRGIPAPSIGPWTIDTPLEFFYLAAAVFIVGAIVYDAICYSVQGRALMAMRDDETAARASGIDVQRLKVVAFGVSAVFSAVGGSLMAHYYTAITPELGLMTETVAVLVIAVLGGLGSIAGAVFGSAVVNLVPEVFRNFGDFRLLAYGLLLFLTVLFQPQGVFSIGRRLAHRA
jgi:branched-chain amino acid transport system permease protein